MTHAWDVILKFYEMKMGHEYNSTPARKLSQSFGLDLSGSASSNKQVGTLRSDGPKLIARIFAYKKVLFMLLEGS